MGIQWVALLPNGNNLIGIQIMIINNQHAFAVSEISVTGIVSDPYWAKPDDTFVNFFWADIDPVRSMVYILSGDENSLTTLDATLYSFNMTSHIFTSVLVDNSAYTLSNLYVDPISGNIYSVSPGLFDKSDWAIVLVNPMTGAVGRVSSIVASFQFLPYYGGGIYNGLAGNELYHTFKWQNTGATALAAIEITTGGVLFLTDINLGINNRRTISSIIAF